MTGLRCTLGVHKWSKWDLFHRWCRRCRKVELTPIGQIALERARDIAAEGGA